MEGRKERKEREEVNYSKKEGKKVGKMEGRRERKEARKN